MTISLLPKLAGETRRYRHDWSPFLGADTIASHSTSITGATLVSTTVEAGEQSVVFKVSAGVAGVPAQITHAITTAGGDVETEVFVIPIGAEEPVTLREAKAQTRMLEDDSEDEFIASLITPARAHVEDATRYSFVAEVRTETFNAWNDFLEIVQRPIASVDEITYSTTNDTADDVVLDDFIAPLGRYPFRIYPYASFPTLVDGGTITVTYTTGVLPVTRREYARGKRAMLLLIGIWFDNRGECPLTEDQQRAFEMVLEGLRPLSAY